MKTILTLVSNPQSHDLTPALAGEVRNALTKAGADAGSLDWLCPSIACDVELAAIQEDAVAGVVAATLNEAPVDFLVQADDARKKRLLIADMDSTMITVECLDELADFAGLKTEVSAITERAMRGELNFEGALRERVGMLKGLGVEALEATYESRIELMPGGRELIRTMKASGALTVLVSGGFTFFTERVAKEIGFAEQRGNTLVIADGKLTGDVGTPILGRDAKKASLIAARKRIGASAAETMAVGDGANDLDMLKEAGLGVAYHAKPIVAEAARARVDHGDLTALLYFQGYRASEFVSA